MKKEITKIYINKQSIISIIYCLAYSISMASTGIIVGLIDLIKFKLAKNKEDLVKPKYEVNIVSLIICLLFLIYFLVPINI